MANVAGAEPHHVDRHVGALIRVKRRALGLSQEALADAIGVTFQQVQKYERGANRVSSSKLFEIAQTLDVPLATFFEGLAPDQTHTVGSSAIADFLEQRGARELMVAFKDMSPALQSRLVALAKTMAGGDAD